MNNINLIPINATGSLNKVIALAKDAFSDVIKIAVNDLAVKNIDILVFDYPEAAIPELGIGGRTFNANLIYLNIDPKANINKNDIVATLYHELHHAARFASEGYGDTLIQAMYSEGLACLYEQEKTGITSIYAQTKLTKNSIELAKKEFNNKQYDHAKWFYDGDAQIPRWFGYSYGYQLAKELSVRQGKTAALLVDFRVF